VKVPLRKAQDLPRWRCERGIAAGDPVADSPGKEARHKSRQWSFFSLQLTRFWTYTLYRMQTTLRMPSSTEIK